VRTLFWKNKKNSSKVENDSFQYPTRSITIHELRQAVESYAKQLKQGIYLSSIINEDLTIDYKLLGPFLKAIPEETYYMSRETYEIFPEHQKQLVLEMDMVQKAVDRYMEITKELPVIDGDPYKKVSCFKLEKLNLLSERPKETFYITDEEFLITYKKP
jgi:hypothetical protein